MNELIITLILTLDVSREEAEHIVDLIFSDDVWVDEFEQF